MDEIFILWHKRDASRRRLFTEPRQVMLIGRHRELAGDAAEIRICHFRTSSSELLGNVVNLIQLGIFRNTNECALFHNLVHYR